MNNMNTDMAPWNLGNQGNEDNQILQSTQPMCKSRKKQFHLWFPMFGRPSYLPNKKLIEPASRFREYFLLSGVHLVENAIRYPCISGQNPSPSFWRIFYF